MLTISKVIALTALAALSTPLSISAQLQNPGAGTSPSGPTGPIPVNDVTPAFYARIAARQRAKREEKLVSDADRMAVLANQLKAALDKGQGARWRWKI